MTISPEARQRHRQWLVELTAIPTAAGREARVIEWIRGWVTQRPGAALTDDAAGNLVIASATPSDAQAPPLFFTAHLDHPAFVVERVIGPGTVQVGFRGGVMDDYFEEARILVHGAGGAVAGAITDRPETGCASFKSYLAELDGDAAEVRPGDIATWNLPPSRIDDGLLHAPACDDLAAAAAALAAYDVLLESGGPGEARLLFTRAEEIGFIGALAACREGTMPRGSRVLALENSRSFADSPIGGGPIVRVGDRLSIFSPGLTGAVAGVAEKLAGGPPPTASQKAIEPPAWNWQRKLMSGGACEATVFCDYGYEATCICLPLGNYHNMADLAAVQSGTNATPARIAPEFISIGDFEGLVDLLVACARSLPASAPIRPKLDKLWADKSFVLTEP